MAPRRSGRGRTQQHLSNIAHPNAHQDEQHQSSSSSSSNFEFTVDTAQADTTASMKRATIGRKGIGYRGEDNILGRVAQDQEGNQKSGRFC